MPQEQAFGLDNLRPAEGSRKERTRRGRGTGSGLGKTSGRGGKGQTARSGKGRPRGFEGGQMPLYRRLPKFGFNAPFKKQYALVNVFNLENHFNSGDTVNAESLLKAGLIKSATALIKVLGEGSLTKKLVVKAHKFSKSATQKINQAGGQVEEIKLPGESAEETEVGGG